MHKTFLSCDWGTSSFRLRLIDADTGKILGEAISDEGISWVHDEWGKAAHAEDKRVGFYFSVIEWNIKSIRKKVKKMEAGIPVIISGMASANIGMIELPYTILPFSAGGEDIEVKKIGAQDFFGHDLQLISGARTSTDVMRGEEIQLVGCADGDMKGKQLFIFTGTHSKHVMAESGHVTDIKTYMTGELFGVLGNHGVLAASIVDFSLQGDEEENSAAFVQGVKNGAGQNLLHSLFRVRTNQLLRRFSKEANYHYLSGLLIGTELDDISKTQMETLTIVGDEYLLNNYRKALHILDINCKLQTKDAAAATISGHLKIYKRLYC